jgi:hypothetical protein
MKRRPKRRLEFYVGMDQLRALQALATKTDVSVAAQIRTAIDEYLKKRKKK